MVGDTLPTLSLPSLQINIARFLTMIWQKNVLPHPVAHCFFLRRHKSKKHFFNVVARALNFISRFFSAYCHTSIAIWQKYLKHRMFPNKLNVRIGLVFHMHLNEWYSKNSLDWLFVKRLGVNVKTKCFHPLSRNKCLELGGWGFSKPLILTETTTLAN